MERVDRERLPYVDHRSYFFIKNFLEQDIEEARSGDFRITLLIKDWDYDLGPTKSIRFTHILYQKKTDYLPIG